MFNKSEIMRKAWANYNRFNKGLPFCAKAFGRELSRVWSSVKLAASRAAMTDQDRTQEAIVILESKTRWTQADYQRHTELHAEYAAAA
jgi:hypothetical protein